MEQQILDYYIQYQQRTFKKCNLLNKQLFNGFIKINSSSKHFERSKKLIIKISGIWETKTEIGITYKIFDANKMN